jgi:hypothetical protein
MTKQNAWVRKYVRDWRFLIFALIVGTLISLISGLIENAPVVGEPNVTYYGYPIVWLFIKSPPATEISPVFLLIDIVFWSGVAFLILFLIELFQTKERDA